MGSPPPVDTGQQHTAGQFGPAAGGGGGRYALVCVLAGPHSVFGSLVASVVTCKGRTLATVLGFLYTIYKGSNREPHLQGLSRVFDVRLLADHLAGGRFLKIQVTLDPQAVVAFEASHSQLAPEGFEFGE